MTATTRFVNNSTHPGDLLRLGVTTLRSSARGAAGSAMRARRDIRIVRLLGHGRRASKISLGVFFQNRNGSDVEGSCLATRSATEKEDRYHHRYQTRCDQDLDDHRSTASRRKKKKKKRKKVEGVKRAGWKDGESWSESPPPSLVLSGDGSDGKHVISAAKNSSAVQAAI